MKLEKFNSVSICIYQITVFSYFSSLSFDLLEIIFVNTIFSLIIKGGGATGHAKKAGRRPDPKFDVYTQISSDLQSKFKNQSQNNSGA
jgi:hypothetical protein